MKYDDRAQNSDTITGRSQEEWWSNRTRVLYNIQTRQMAETGETNDVDVRARPRLLVFLRGSIPSGTLIHLQIDSIHVSMHKGTCRYEVQSWHHDTSQG